MKTTATQGSRVPGIVVGGVGIAALGVGIAGIVYSWNVDKAAVAQQPCGPNYKNPTVTRAQYDSLSWIYPGALVLTGVGLVAAGGGAYFIVRPLATGGAVTEIGGQL